jgi:ribosomal protein L37AE/L43A
VDKISKEKCSLCGSEGGYKPFELKECKNCKQKFCIEHIDDHNCIKSKTRMKYTKFCPSCGSENIDWILPHIWSMWQCKECGYRGPVVIEDSTLAKHVRKEYSKKL